MYANLYLVTGVLEEQAKEPLIGELVQVVFCFILAGFLLPPFFLENQFSPDFDPDPSWCTVTLIAIISKGSRFKLTVKQTLRHLMELAINVREQLYSFTITIIITAKKKFWYGLYIYFLIYEFI
jgi:hypothetical protein